MSQFITKATALEGVMIITPRVEGESREYIFEQDLTAMGLEESFVQHTQERFARGVLRGLHFQRRDAQARLISVTSGSVYAVAVDLRPESRDYGAAYATELSAVNEASLYIPPYYALGYLTLERDSEVVINYSTPYNPAEESGMIWDDEILMIDWQFDRWEIDQKYLNISQRDKKFPSFRSYNPNSLWINRAKVRRQR